MRLSRWFVALSLALFLAAAARGGQAAADAEKKEYEKFTGTWEIVSVESEGQKMPDEMFKGVKLVLKGNTFSMEQMGVTYKGTYKVDVSKKPKTMEITFTEGPNKGEKISGIYELDGDTYKVCLAMTADGPQPKEFAAKAGSGHVYEVLKRVKAGK